MKKQASSHSERLRHRAVFFLPGFDPAPLRQHRERYRREGAAQAAISGYELDVTGSDAGGWNVVSTQDGQAVTARIDVLEWRDIVARHMRGGPLWSYWLLLRTAWIYISSGALWRLARLRKGPVLAVLYPVFMLLGQAVLALGLGALAGQVILVGAKLLFVGASTGSLAALTIGAITAWSVLRWFKRQDGRFLAHYLMRDFAYAASAQGAYPEELEARLDAFAERIAAADADEVLLVGHSSGAYLAISLLADLRRRGLGGRLSLLTLGHVVPMVSFLPDATRLRADLAALSVDRGITWLDVSAPGDGCSFALCDPVAVSGVAEPQKFWPLVRSAAFRQTLSPERWHALRWRFFRSHFQYLCAFDRPGEYDYFRLTAGPLPLAARIADWQPSRARIERPLSGYRSQAA